VSFKNFQEVRVTEWVEDSEERFPTCFGELSNLEWLQMEMRRIAEGAPQSCPIIRIHPRYFDKDSHGRHVHKRIALFRFIGHVEADQTHKSQNVSNP
jgi:hypothetical protein